jgi:hypothetical protein
MFDSLGARLRAVRASDSLYFAALLSEETIREAFGAASEILDSARIYTTATTVWTFLAQVLSAHHGCVAAVAKLNAFRLARGYAPCSPRTGAFCIARDQLDEQALHRLVTHTGREIEQAVPDAWRWKGHRVIVADGTTVTMADTAANQRAYPQQQGQQPGCGSPILRCVVLFALASGTVLEAALGKYQGQASAEIRLFRELDGTLQAGDVLVADRAYSGWFDLARLIRRGVQVVVRKHSGRATDFRTGVRLGKDDHVVRWPKPPQRIDKSPENYHDFPEFLTLREIRIRVATPGFRTREVIVVASLLNAVAYSRADLAELFRRRWHAELNLRSLKTVLQMEHLRCLEPHRVRNELRMHLLAYNLIRQVMSEAALRGGGTPWSVSFKAALTTLVELLPILHAVSTDAWYETLLTSVRRHVVGNRPDRFEPRLVKRRPKPFKLLQRPRQIEKLHLAK